MEEGPKKLRTTVTFENTIISHLREKKPLPKNQQLIAKIVSSKILQKNRLMKFAQSGISAVLEDDCRMGTNLKV